MLILHYVLTKNSVRNVIFELCEQLLRHRAKYYKMVNVKWSIYITVPVVIYAFLSMREGFSVFVENLEEER